MKFGIKSIVWGVVSGAIVDLLVSIPVAWWEWQKASKVLARSGQEADGGMFFETLLSWFGPVLLVTVPLCILFIAWRSGRKT